MLKQAVSVIALVLLCAHLVGCEAQSKGFSLPPGDAEKGQATFTQLQCNHCHRIKGLVERVENSPHADIDVRLGGPVSRVKTYGELVTSIIHPAAKLSRGDSPSTIGEDSASKMPNYNQQMTVEQLIDLTTFLQKTYIVWVPEHRPYYLP